MILIPFLNCMLVPVSFHHTLTRRALFDNRDLHDLRPGLRGYCPFFGLEPGLRLPWGGGACTHDFPPCLSTVWHFLADLAAVH